MKVRSILGWIWRGKTGTSAALQAVIFRFVIIGLNIATGVVTARLLGPEGRGILAAIGLWPRLLGIVFALGLESALLYRIQKTPEKRSSLFTAALLLGVIQSFIAVCIGIIFIPNWMSEYSTKTIRAAQCFMLISPIELCSLIFLGAYKASSSFTVINRIRTVVPIFQALLLAILVIFDKTHPISASLAYKLPIIFLFIWQLQDLLKTYNLNLSDVKQNINDLLGYSTRSAGITILNQLEIQADQVFLVGYLPPEVMGFYVVGLSSSRMLGIFQDSLSEILFPKAAGKSIKNIFVLAEHTARISIFIVIIAASILMVVSPLLIPLAYGNEFSSSIYIFRILCVKILFEKTALLLSQAFMAAGKPGVVTGLQIVGLIITVPSMVYLVPRYGLNGATSALLISAISRFLLVMIAYPVVLKMSMPSLIFNKSDISFIRKKLSARLLKTS